MAHFEGTIIITDPGNFLSESDWNENNRTAPFEIYMIDDNFWGDGKWIVRDKKTKKIISTYKTFSGYTGVFLEKDILTYFPDFYKIISRGHYIKIDNFKGDITNKIDNDRAIRVWESDGNINFIINE